MNIGHNKIFELLLQILMHGADCCQTALLYVVDAGLVFTFTAVKEWAGLLLQ